ncbi:hypothetical protein OFO00_06015 [Campylobacter sp. VBCF_04 NA7]|nr:MULTISPECIES: hypothetical protein [unclassified Campylobacter]MDA3058022.1 hypothetical protein [Campylobacter sp. VBCF_04 NA7]
MRDINLTSVMHALTQIPWSVQTTADLIQFSKTAKSLVLPKILPSGE